MGSTDDLTRAFRPWLENCTFAPAGTAVRCGVSAGADSLALLVLAVVAGLDVVAVHVDHGLRANTEARSVAVAAARFGARFESLSVDVAPGSNLEERARAARLAALGPDALTGHTADDQAETVLLQLMWGAGPAGTAGMKPGPTKPLLGLRRTDTEAVCRRAGLEWFSDPTNTDLRYRRNRVRHELIPLMNQIADRDIVPLLNRSASVSRATVAAVEELLPEGDPTDTRWLGTLSDPVARLIVRAWLEQQTGRPISASATDRVMRVVAHEIKATELRGGARLERTDGYLRTRLSNSSPDTATEPVTGSSA
ncbi:MAG: tRNA lysidine(34) synthetase TilS [Acidimicrobiia bacterium]|nr:tRNA lysidine(34) synthetase TilS [Acidimicrobiia bacterium]